MEIIDKLLDDNLPLNFDKYLDGMINGVELSIEDKIGSYQDYDQGEDRNMFSYRK